MPGCCFSLLQLLLIYVVWDGWLNCIATAHQECQDALGMENGAIPDEHITASSEYSGNHAAIQGRLNFKAGGGKQEAWSSRSNDVNQWLHVDLGNKNNKETGVATQGRNAYDQWVTKYELQYSDDGVMFHYYKESGQSGRKEFVGNTDAGTVVYHKLGNAIRARYIRFRPTTWHHHISMRVGVYGCIYKNCAELYKTGHHISGVYPIDPDNGGAFDVYCDQSTADGGWTVFQKRLDGSVDFYRGWDDYKRGFANLTVEYWLGLDKIHRLTKKQSRLRVYLEDTTGTTAYAKYHLFGVADEANKYKLSLGTYSGTTGDSFLYHRGMAFSTKDQDNDIWYKNCATTFKGGWWFKNCHHSNLIGFYHHGQHSSAADGVDCDTWKGLYYSAKRAEMKIKPVHA